MMKFDEKKLAQLTKGSDHLTEKYGEKILQSCYVMNVSARS